VAVPERHYSVLMGNDRYQNSAAALAESPETEHAEAAAFESLDTTGLEMAIAEIELQERWGLAGGSVALSPPDVTEAGLEAHPENWGFLLDDIAKRQGLKGSAEVTPDYLAGLAEEARVAEVARRESLGLKTMTREVFRAELAEAYAAIDENAGSA